MELVQADFMFMVLSLSACAVATVLVILWLEGRD